MKAKLDRCNYILGCPYDGSLLGIVSSPIGEDKVPIAALVPYQGNPTVQENDVLRCSECQKTFLVTEITNEGGFPETHLLEV